MTDMRLRSQAILLGMVPAAVGGAICLAVLAILGAIFDGRQFFSSWLFAWMFWLGVSLGAMAIVMMHHLIGGGWGLVIRRFGEVAAQCLPLMIVLFIPIILGVRYLYPWAQPGATDPAIIHKARYLNWPFWTIRSIVYLLIFSAMAWMMRTTSLAHDQTPAIPILVRLRRLSAGGLTLYFFVMFLAGVDWIMSRDPHWHSTVYGFIVCVGQAVSAACFLIIALWWVADEEPFRSVLHPNYLNDLGSVLITFVILWAYLSFAQFLVIWVGNIQSEITWYIQRTDGGWRWVGAALITFHFLAPFFILLQRPVKRKAGRLAAIAVGLWIIHAVNEIYWIQPSDVHTHVWGAGRWLLSEFMNLLALCGIGGLWFATFLWLMKGTPMLPVGERVPVIPVDHGHGQRPTPGALD